MNVILMEKNLDQQLTSKQLFRNNDELFEKLL